MLMHTFHIPSPIVTECNDNDDGGGGGGSGVVRLSACLCVSSFCKSTLYYYDYCLVLHTQRHCSRFSLGVSVRVCVCVFESSQRPHAAFKFTLNTFVWRGRMVMVILVLQLKYNRTKYRTDMSVAHMHIEKGSKATHGVEITRYLNEKESSREYDIEKKEHINSYCSKSFASNEQTDEQTDRQTHTHTRMQTNKLTQK